MSAGCGKAVMHHPLGSQEVGREDEREKENEDEEEQQGKEEERGEAE